MASKGHNGAPAADASGAVVVAGAGAGAARTAATGSGGDKGVFLSFVFTPGMVGEAPAAQALA